MGTVATPEPEQERPRGQLDIDDYLAASSDASSRTRAIILIMVVASVLALTGLFNSLQSQWMHERIKTLSDPYGSYMKSKIGWPPEAKYFSNQAQYARWGELYKKREEALCTAVETAYIEGSLVIRVPFFGFTFDVNDLGLLSSVGFLIILSCYRFFLVRELDNLRVSFTEARTHSDFELTKYYKLLAMRQVFTIPLSGYVRRSQFLLYLPKLITWMPFLLVISIYIHDWVTGWIGFTLMARRFLIEQIIVSIDLLLIFVLSVVITRRLLWMDQIWDVVYEYITDNDETKSATQPRWDRVFRKA